MDLPIIWYCPLQPAASRKQFVEDLQGADVDGGFGVEFQVADYGGGYVATDAAGERNQHCRSQVRTHELSHNSLVLISKRQQVSHFRTEAEGNAELQQEIDVKIAEIRLQGIQGQYLMLTPFIQAVLCRSVIYCTVNHIRHEQGDCILEYIVPDSEQRIFRRHGAGIP